MSAQSPPAEPSQLPANWDPRAYGRFPDHRLRPALELLGRVSVEQPLRIGDLGCGPGHITRLMARRWPAATLWGVDSSDAMLDHARAGDDLPIEWVNADIARWRPDGPLDLLVANSLFHLLAHRQLLPQLLSLLRPGGQLALQMPDRYDEPWYRLMIDTLRDAGEGGTPLGDAPLHAKIVQRHVMSQRDYYDLLADRCSALDIWDTEYLQVLDGKEPVYEWVSAAGLRPVLASLNDADAQRFLGCYRERLRVLYPARDDGRTLFPFRRRFVVATLRDESAK